MHSPVGQNHPVCISQFNSPMLPPACPGPLRQPDTLKVIINKETWPKRGSGSRGASSYVRGVVTHPFVVPKFVSELQIPVKTGSGYQDAHGIYDEMQQFFAQRAMSNGEVVVIKVTMMSLKPGNRNPSVVSVRVTHLSHPLYLSCYSQNISETIFNIPVHIGVQELKNIAYLTLLPPFLIWSKDDILAIKDLCLRFKDWVELIPLEHGHEDVGTISSKFFQPKGRLKTIQFNPNKVLELYLELAYSRYAEILGHLEDMEDELVRLLHLWTVFISKPPQRCTFLINKCGRCRYHTSQKWKDMMGYFPRYHNHLATHHLQPHL
jgi:hypothetical protein